MEWVPVEKHSLPLRLLVEKMREPGSAEPPGTRVQRSTLLSCLHENGSGLGTKPIHPDTGPASF
jgi:hypothetical protein